MGDFMTGGTGAALFEEGATAQPKPKLNQQNLGDDYVPPVGLPEWKQPSFDDDDQVRQTSVLQDGIGNKFIFIKSELKVAKAFYFFFFGAFGSLFPLMAVYFKGIGMDAAQCGILVGIRPIVEFIATPFWHGISDRFQAGKLLLLMSVLSWVVFTLPIGYLHPPVVSCKEKDANGSVMLIEPRYLARDDVVVDVVRERRDVSLFPQDNFYAIDQLEHRIKRSVESSDERWAPGYVVGTSPEVINFRDVHKDMAKGKEWVSPSFSNEVFERAGVAKVFFLVLLLVVIGEFFASPAVPLADSAVITALGDRQDKYGSQRMWGSIGWGVCMFIMGIVLDYSTIFPAAKCSESPGERNYDVCFYAFSGMMILAFFTATQIPFRYTLIREEDLAMNDVKINNADTKKVPAKSSEEKLKEQAKKMKFFAKELQGMPEFTAVIKTLSNLRMLLFMVVAWVMGVGMGLIFTFLFWHLQELGGHPTIFGIASVINHVSEMGAYFYSFKIISQYGHVKVLMAGLLGNLLRFIYISYLTFPWLVLPFEFLQGITHAAVWAACCSFISHNTDEKLRANAQGVLQGIHHGFGKFCGAVFGGMFIKQYGTARIFLIYGLACGVVLILFTLFNFYNITEGKFNTDLSEEIDPRNVVQGEHLAPHGVPSSSYKPRPRSRRNSEDGSAPQSNPTVPQSNNPFLEPGTQQPAGGNTATNQNYYGGSYSQAQSGYSSSGFGY